MLADHRQAAGGTGTGTGTVVITLISTIIHASSDPHWVWSQPKCCPADASLILMILSQFHFLNSVIWFHHRVVALDSNEMIPVNVYKIVHSFISSIKIIYRLWHMFINEPRCSSSSSILTIDIEKQKGWKKPTCQVNYGISIYIHIWQI